MKAKAGNTLFLKWWMHACAASLKLKLAYNSTYIICICSLYILFFHHAPAVMGLTGEMVHPGLLERKKVWGHFKWHINMLNTMAIMGCVLFTVVTLAILIGSAVTACTFPFVQAMILSIHIPLKLLSHWIELKFYCTDLMLQIVYFLFSFFILFFVCVH